MVELWYNISKYMLQRLRFKIILYLAIFAILLLALAFWIYLARAQSRDYQRLADLKITQDILASYYGKFATYQLPNCLVGETVSQCLSTKVGSPVINNIIDPLNNTSYSYVIGSLADSDYEINFSLEVGIGGLSRGNYVLTKNGIRR